MRHQQSEPPQPRPGKFRSEPLAFHQRAIIVTDDCAHMPLKRSFNRMFNGLGVRVDFIKFEEFFEFAGTMNPVDVILVASTLRLENLKGKIREAVNAYKEKNPGSKVIAALVMHDPSIYDGANFDYIDPRCMNDFELLRKTLSP